MYGLQRVGTYTYPVLFIYKTTGKRYQGNIRKRNTESLAAESGLSVDRTWRLCRRILYIHVCRACARAAPAEEEAFFHLSFRMHTV